MRRSLLLISLVLAGQVAVSEHACGRRRDHPSRPGGGAGDGAMGRRTSAEAVLIDGRLPGLPRHARAAGGAHS